MMTTEDEGDSLATAMMEGDTLEIDLTALDACPKCFSRTAKGITSEGCSECGGQPHARRRRANRLERMAEEAYAEHVVRDGQAFKGQWLIGREGDSNRLTEIAVLRWGAVVVHGDGPDLVLRGPNDRNPIQVLRSVASSSLEHLATRIVAASGSKHWSRYMDFDHESARDDIRDTLADYLMEEGARRAELRHLIESSEIIHDPDALHRELQVVDPDRDWEVGFVIPSPLFYAAAAVRRLVELLGLN